MYIVKFTCKEAVNAHGTVVTDQGKESFISRDQDGWVPYTMGYPSMPDISTPAIFKTKESAEKAAKQFCKNPHPWYCIPDEENVKIVEVREKTKTVITGYEEI